jgi:nitroimidazol reductase NimA-like FMN-containing flavoprotein (pyridoxamine 5'-phosphate oxidase superfamily)
MALPRELSLSDHQIDQILSSEWNCRIATRGPGDRINLTPMWFGWAGGKIYLTARGQKVVNLRRSPFCTVLVDRNEKFPELEGIMLQGRARVLESADEEKADPHLEEVRIQMARKYNGGHGRAPVADPPPLATTATGRNRRWVVITPERRVTWDNHKLGTLRPSR